MDKINTTKTAKIWTPIQRIIERYADRHEVSFEDAVSMLVMRGALDWDNSEYKDEVAFECLEKAKKELAEVAEKPEGEPPANGFSAYDKLAAIVNAWNEDRSIMTDAESNVCCWGLKIWDGIDFKMKAQIMIIANRVYSRNKMKNKRGDE